MTNYYDDAIKDAKASLATWPEWLKIPEKRGNKMVDKMLSAEKVSDKLSELYAEFTKPQYDKKAVMCAQVFAAEFREALDSGQLDADCPKCGGTGVPYDMEKRCDCQPGELRG